jgi:cellulose synthase/poly-beta-1,6-N-acetylglucosamine synthase-like glycosyltransferase
MLPTISIIVPAFNEEAVIGECVDSLLNLDYPEQLLEIIVIDDASTDRTNEILSSFSRIRVLSGGHQGPSAARNRAIKLAKGEFIAFTDADCIVPPEWLKELMRGFESNLIAGVGGIQKPRRDASEMELLVDEVFNLLGIVANYSRKKSQLGLIDHNASCNVIYRKSVLLQLGGFDEALWPGEDVELDYRITKAGYRLVQNPNVAVWHKRPNNFTQFNAMMYKYGQAQAYLVLRYGPFRKIHFIPFVLPIAMLLFCSSTFTMTLYFGLFKSMLGILLTAFLLLLIFGMRSNVIFNPTALCILVATFYQWHKGFYFFLFNKRKMLP